MIGTPLASQRLRELERRLPAVLHDHALGLFDLDDLEHVLERQRLEVQAIGGVVVGRHGFRVAVDHDGFVAVLAQRERGVHAAVVELDALPDPVRAAAEHDDLVAIGRVGLALVLVGRVHVGGGRGELGRARVHALVHRAHAEGAAQRAHRGFVGAGELREARIGEALALELRAGALRRARRGRRRRLRLRSRRVPRSGRGTTDRRTTARARPRRSCRRGTRRRGRTRARGRLPCTSRRSVARSASSPRSRPVGSRPTLPVSSPRNAFCSDSWNVRPIAITSPTDFICVVRRASAGGNFSNAKRGILVTT